MVSHPPHAADSGDSPPLDCETAALFRSVLCPVFDAAASWGDLIHRLAGKGYGLAIRDGRLVLLDMSTGARVCTARYLGTNLRELSARLGRPVIQARRDAPASGDFQNAG